MAHEIKINKARKIAETGKFPQTFDARIAAIGDELLAVLTAKQIAAIIDGPMKESYNAGYHAGYEDFGK